MTSFPLKNKIQLKVAHSALKFYQSAIWGVQRGIKKANDNVYLNIFPRETLKEPAE